MVFYFAKFQSLCFDITTLTTPFTPFTIILAFASTIYAVNIASSSTRDTHNASHYCLLCCFHCFGGCSPSKHAGGAGYEQGMCKLLCSFTHDTSLIGLLTYFLLLLVMRRETMLPRPCLLPEWKLSGGYLGQITHHLRSMTQAAATRDAVG